MMASGNDFSLPKNTLRKKEKEVLEKRHARKSVGKEIREERGEKSPTVGRRLTGENSNEGWMQTRKREG